MAWQLELVDQKTGQLSLDESEQASLIEALAFQVGQSPIQSPLPGKRLPHLPYSGQA
jgi:hypothetical protein